MILQSKLFPMMLNEFYETLESIPSVIGREDNETILK